MSKELATKIADRWASEKTASQKTAGIRVIDSLINARDFGDLLRSLKPDEQSIKLAIDVYHELGERLKLTDNEEYALTRLKNSMFHEQDWDEGTQRNNIFKAADLMGMKLPSGMF